MNEQTSHTEDAEFLQSLNELIVGFIQSGEAKRQLDPMNGYQRRLVHKLGALYALDSESVGEEEGRCVLLTRSENTRLPDANVNYVEQLLQEAASEAPREPREPREARPPREPREREQRPPRDSRDRPDRGGRGGGGGRREAPQDMSNQVYYTKPGTHLIVRDDGSFGVPQKEERGVIVHERTVEQAMFKVIDNKIVCPSDPNWRG